MWVAYSRIGSHLAARARAGERLVTLSLAEVEALLGRRLPRWAHTAPTWWGNALPRGTHALGASYRWYGWLSVGWEAEADLERQVVTFHYRRDQ